MVSVHNKPPLYKTLTGTLCTDAGAEVPSTWQATVLLLALLSSLGAFPDAPALGRDTPRRAPTPPAARLCGATVCAVLQFFISRSVSLVTQTFLQYLSQILARLPPKAHVLSVSMGEAKESHGLSNVSVQCPATQEALQVNLGAKVAACEAAMGSHTGVLEVLTYPVRWATERRMFWKAPEESSVQTGIGIRKQFKGSRLFKMIIEAQSGTTCQFCCAAQCPHRAHTHMYSF